MSVVVLVLAFIIFLGVGAFCQTLAYNAIEHAMFASEPAQRAMETAIFLAFGALAGVFYTAAVWLVVSVAT